MKKLISLIICALLIVTSLGACTKTEDEGYFVRTKRCEYGRLSVSLSKYTKDNKKLSENELKDIYNKTCTVFEDAYTLLSVTDGLEDINSPVDRVLDVDKKIISALNDAYSFSKLTNGLFNPCGGAFTELVKSGKSSDEEAVKEALSHTGLDKFTLEKASVTKNDPNSKMDLYAYADAYALSAVVEYLKKSNVLFGTVTFNGIAGVFGEKPGGEAFVVDISDGTENGKDSCFYITDGYVAFVSKNFGYPYDFSDGKIDSHVKTSAVYSSDPYCAAVIASIGYSHGKDTLSELYKIKELSFEGVLLTDEGERIYTENANDDSFYKIYEKPAEVE